MSTWLMKICVSDIHSTLKLKSKIAVANSDLSIADFLEITKLDASRKQQMHIQFANHTRK